MLSGLVARAFISKTFLNSNEWIPSLSGRVLIADLKYTSIYREYSCVIFEIINGQKPRVMFCIACHWPAAQELYHKVKAGKLSNIRTSLNINPARTILLLRYISSVTCFAAKILMKCQKHSYKNENKIIWLTHYTLVALHLILWQL